MDHTLTGMTSSTHIYALRSQGHRHSHVHAHDDQGDISHHDHRATPQGVRDYNPHTNTPSGESRQSIFSTLGQGAADFAQILNTSKFTFKTAERLKPFWDGDPLN